MWSWTFDPGVTGQLIRRYTMGNCMLLSWTDYARSKNETKQKLTNNEGKQSKPTQIKCENESQYKEVIVDQTRAITRAIAVLFLFVCFVFCFFKAFAEENGFVGELKHWDIPFWSQKQREHLFRFEQGTSLLTLFVTEPSYVCVCLLLVCRGCWSSSWFLRILAGVRIFSIRVLRFSPLLKNQLFQIPTPI